MPPGPSRARLRLRTVAMFVAAVLVAYGAGVVTGVIGSTKAPSSTQAGVLDEAAARIAASAATPVAKQKLEQAAVDGMLGALGDRWSTYYGPSAYTTFSDSLEGRYTGIGVWVTATRGGGVVVSSVSPSSPASSAGLVAGESLLSVDGTATAGASMATVATLLRGVPGTTAVLSVAQHGSTRVVHVTRGVVTTKDVTVEHRSDGVTVIRVAAFTRGVGRQVRDAVKQATGQPAAADAGIVLDLRDNPGGLLGDEAVEVASAFLSGGPVVTFDQRGDSPSRYDAVGAGNSTVPLVVLVDGGTASAAEVVTGALQDRDRAVVVGSRTFGKGSVQEPERLSDGSAIELTVGHYLTPDGRSIDGIGIEPDVLVDPSALPAIAERRAVQVLTGLQASLTTSGRG